MELFSIFLKCLFWGASFLVVYPYIIYPLVIYLLGKNKKTVLCANLSDDVLPSVTLIISAYNEEDVIGKKLQNSIELNYPEKLLDILVVSDCSDDSTDDIVRSRGAKDSRIRLYRQEERNGKSSGLTAAMSTVDSDIVVFSDANAIYEANALRLLVNQFQDQSVGYVVGSALYMDDEKDAVKDSEGLYWKYELLVKSLESKYDSVVGGDGAIYAIRRALFQPLKSSDINDFVNPLQIVAKGFKGRFQSDARCYEYASDEFSKEFGRKRRIVNRSWRAVRTYWHLFSVEEHPKFLFMLLSHKVIRWFSLLFILVAVVSCSIILMIQFTFLYMLLLGGILSTVVLAALGWLQDTKGGSTNRIFYIPYYFYFVSAASLMGVWDNSRGVQHITWGHIRN